MGEARGTPLALRRAVLAEGNVVPLGLKVLRDGEPGAGVPGYTIDVPTALGRETPSAW